MGISRLASLNVGLVAVGVAASANSRNSAVGATTTETAP